MMFSIRPHCRFADNQPIRGTCLYKRVNNGLQENSLAIVGDVQTCLLLFIDSRVASAPMIANNRKPVMLYPTPQSLATGYYRPNYNAYQYSPRFTRPPPTPPVHVTSHPPPSAWICGILIVILLIAAVLVPLLAMTHTSATKRESTTSSKSGVK